MKKLIQYMSHLETTVLNFKSLMYESVKKFHRNYL